MYCLLHPRRFLPQTLTNQQGNCQPTGHKKLSDNTMIKADDPLWWALTKHSDLEWNSLAYGGQYEIDKPSLRESPLLSAICSCMTGMHLFLCQIYKQTSSSFDQIMNSGHRQAHSWITRGQKATSLFGWFNQILAPISSSPVFPQFYQAIPFNCFRLARWVT